MRYSALLAGNVVRLADSLTSDRVSVLPLLGNNAVEFVIHGENILRFEGAPDDPQAQLEITVCGTPFLAPWANRLDDQAFAANGRRYRFDMELGNVTGATPIHGFLRTAPWHVQSLGDDEHGAWVTSRLEFFREPAWMKQFPFAHVIEMTHRLSNRVLEVDTRIENLSNEPMPVSIGFHPYFWLHGAPREQWILSPGARIAWELDDHKLPTGSTKRVADLFGTSEAIPLAGIELDHVFSDLIRDSSGRATTTVRAGGQRLDVTLGPKYQSVIVYAPQPPAARGPAPERPFICIEPMAAITNAMNLAARGAYGELQTIPPGGAWQERFWITSSSTHDT